MRRFVLKQLKITGNSKRDSIVMFFPKINLLTGESNLGKTKTLECIDYCLGKRVEDFESDIPFYTEATGYTDIFLTIETSSGLVELHRSLNPSVGVGCIFVTSSAFGLQEEKYNLYGNYLSQKSFSRFMLEQLDIDPEHKLVKNKLYQSDQLSWRNLITLSIIGDEDIARVGSILLPDDKSERYKAYSLLLLILEDKDFSKDEKEYDVQKIRSTGKSAVKEYVNEQIKKCYSLKAELNTRLDKFADIDLEKRVSQLMEELENEERTLNQALKRRGIILQKILGLQKDIRQLSADLNGYHNLLSQYESDLNRLDLIVSGGAALENDNQIMFCPVCGSIMTDVINQKYKVASKEEYKRITDNREQLNNLCIDLNEDLKRYKEELSSAKTEEIKLTNEIEQQIQPKIEELKSSIERYKEYLEISKTLSSINSIEANYKEDLNRIDLETEDEDIKEYEPEKEFSAYFASELSSRLKEYLKGSQFEDYRGAAFDIDRFDAEVNGKKKIIYSRGYRTFINTVLILAFHDYLAKNDKPCVGFTIIDSPLSALDQGEKNYTEDGMRYGLLKHMCDEENIGQVLLIENQLFLPPLDLIPESINVIRFSKGEKGHGLLVDYTPATKEDE